MRSYFSWILIHILLLQNALCHIFNKNIIKRNEDDLLKGDGQDFAMSQHFPIAKDINYLLLRTLPNKLNINGNKMPQVQVASRINTEPRPIPFNNGKSTRPHPVFQAPPPRFISNIQSVENNNNANNQINFANNEDLTINKEGTRDGNEWPFPQPETPKIVHLDVKCEKNFMKVSIEFDKPFNGLIFSKGHYNYRNCLYLPPNTGRKNVFFDISINSCGTTGNAQGTFYNEDVTSDSGLFFENTVVIQYDPQVQEAWDQARKLRCTWHDQYEKAVSFRPFPVDMLDVVRADFAGDNVGCWMQIQVGKGPWASEVAGIVKIGQTMTMVLAIKDEENKFDMLVRNCIAHDSKRAPIELVDSNGCIMRPKLMTKFTKIKNFGSSASVLSYTHFQAFKFPDSMEVHFQCTIQICRYQCPEQCTQQAGADVINLYNDESNEAEIRKRRDISEHVVLGTLTPNYDSQNQKEVGLNKAIQVVSPRDLSFPLNTADNQMPLVSEAPIESQSICITTYNFVLTLFFMLLACLACLIIAMLLMRRKPNEKIAKDKHCNNQYKLPNLYHNYFK